jgi:hypothetical protein
MWETVIAEAGGLMGLYVALRREIRRSYELLEKDIGHLDVRLTQEVGHLDDRVTQEVGHLHEAMRELRADIRGILGSR